MSSPAATTPTTAKKPAPTPLILPADRSGLQPSPASAEDLLSPTGAPAPSPGVLTPRHARSPSSSLLRSDREAKYAEWFHEMRKTTFSNSRYCYECDKPLPRIVRGGYQCNVCMMTFHDECYHRERPKVCPGKLERPENRIVVEKHLELDPNKLPLHGMIIDMPKSMKPRYFETFPPSFWAMEKLFVVQPHDWVPYTKKKSCCTICRELIIDGKKCRACGYHIHHTCIEDTQDHCTQERLGANLGAALMASASLRDLDLELPVSGAPTTPRSPLSSMPASDAGKRIQMDGKIPKPPGKEFFLNETEGESLAFHVGHELSTRSHTMPKYCYACDELITPMTNAKKCEICRFLFHKSCSKTMVNVCPQKLATRYAFLLKEGQLHHGKAQTLLQLEGLTVRLEPRYFLPFPDLRRFLHFEHVPHVWQQRSYRGATACTYCRKTMIGGESNCRSCNMNVHFECKEKVVNLCQRSDIKRPITWAQDMVTVHEVEGPEEYDRVGTQPLWDDPNLPAIVKEIQDACAEMEVHPSSKSSTVHVFDGKPKLDQLKISKKNRKKPLNNRMERMAQAQREAVRKASEDRRLSGGDGARASTDSRRNSGGGPRRSVTNEPPRRSASADGRVPEKRSSRG